MKPPNDSCVDTSCDFPKTLVFENCEYRMIPYANGYYVSKAGEVVSLRNRNNVPVTRKIVLKNGYPCFIIKESGKNKTIMVHRAVPSAWVRMPESGEVARHLNDIKSDNHLENLTWGTPSENGADKIKNGRSSKGEDRPTHKLTEENVMEIREKYADGFGSAELSKQYCVSQNTILCVVRGSIWKHLPLVPKRKKHVVKRKAPYTDEERANRSAALKKAKESIKRPRYLVPCGCGCGTLIQNIGSDGRYRKYAWGHNMKRRTKNETADL